MAETMIERVAQMIEAALERHGVDEFEGTVDDARAVIAALRVPNAEMKDAGCEVGPDTNSGQFGHDDAEAVYTAMIDAALTQA